jgi:hypothetical protein
MAFRIIFWGIKNRINILIHAALFVKYTFCSPYEIRTRITTVKGWCPNP